MNRLIKRLVPITLLSAGLSWPCAAQHTNSGSASQPQVPQITLPAPTNVLDDPTLMKTRPPVGDALEVKRQAYLHSAHGMLERQRALAKDAERLLRLARELQANAARNDPARLQETMLQEVKTIEQLARSVNERMKERQ